MNHCSSNWRGKVDTKYSMGKIISKAAGKIKCGNKLTMIVSDFGFVVGTQKCGLLRALHQPSGRLHLILS